MKELGFLHPEMEQEVDAWLASRAYSWRQLERGEVRHGEVPLTAKTLQLLLIHQDPVLFCECFCVERDGANAGEPWRFFNYQKPSMRFRGDTVHECGAEVGKTREIVGLAIWMGNGFGPRQRGEGLIGAAQDGHLDSLWDQLLFELRATPYLERRVDWEATRVKPYRKLVFMNGNVFHLRPAGHDGEAFRGLHCALSINLDEAAKLANPKIFDEFYRAGLPGCENRIYSTPDGNRASRFFDICGTSVVVDLAACGTKAPSPAKGKALKFRWSKTMMPPPFWSEERRQMFLERYGGVDSPGFQQNILGNWGDAANSVFPWEQFEPCCQYLPEYVEAKVLWNDAEGVYHVTANRLNPGYSSAARLGDEPDTLGPQALVPILDDRFEAPNFDIAALFRGVFSRPIGHLVAGVDCGSTDDPTEILFIETRGRELRVVARVQLKRFDYPKQRSAIRILDEIFSPSHGWGLDATGVGTALEHLLNEGEGEWSLERRLIGFVMNGWGVDRNPETGEPVIDAGTQRERKATHKEIATRLLQLDVQRRDLHPPRHPEFLAQFTNYTARVSKAGNRVFDSTNDHLIAAAQVARLKLFDLNYGVGAFSPIVFAVPRGMSRPASEGY